MKKRLLLLLLPVVVLTGCGIGPTPSADEGAREANELCGGHTAIAALAKSYGKTRGLIVVCADGKAHPIN